MAPLLFYLVFGLPGAFAYRALNTADTMLGYREGALEYFGKLAARLDDVAESHARTAGRARARRRGGPPCAGCLRGDARRSRRTSSPNAGWTMAAMSGALGVTLAKPGAYSLGAEPTRHRRYLPRAHPDVAGVGDRGWRR